MNRDEPLLLARLTEARAITDALFDGLHPEVRFERPIPERHRILFYLGHLEAFDWNLLASGHALPASVDADFNRLFAFGIDPIDGGLPQDQPGDWPALADIEAYRTALRRKLDEEVIGGLAMGVPGPWANGQGFDPACLLNVAIEHRLMHAETLAYMLHRLPLSAWRDGAAAPVEPEPVRHASDSEVPAASTLLHVPAGTVRLGVSRGASDTFGWDNEFPEHEVQVPAFSIDEHMVSNAQYLAFMRDGGYERADLWTPADWAWRQAQQIRHPVFWRHDLQQGWRLRAMRAELPLPADWPVYVSHAEASAYARWAGKALPSEAQWMRASLGTPLAEANSDFRRWDPEPVQVSGQRSTFGVAGMYGNGWEWTATPFAPYEGFEPFPFYMGYSKDFFDGQHMVLKGGSPRTAACMLRPAFRNWFQPHYQHVYAGFRCVAISHS